MDPLVATDEREMDVEATMEQLGVDREVALIVLGLRDAEVFNDGGLASVRPLTDEQRRRLRLGRSPEEVLAELGELDEEPA